ncbi:GntR family transcriptional regulator [Acutalibacter muris]|uniref:GntR family transcriptional regulator n=1 Tax=Acutalibacter muris TaxID=1796620 RepID=UPI001C3F06CF|nr:GntR family transcriptional regulator [Acutalibacter muris]
MITETSKIPLYQQVKEDIKSAIQQGKYQPKEKIPPEPALSEYYAVSRITVRRAVEDLCAEGYLVKIHGRGTFVTAPRVHRKFTAGSPVESFTETCGKQGLASGAVVIDRRIAEPEERQRTFLRLSPGGLLLHIQRVRTADGQPIFLENLFLPYEPYKPLLSTDLTDVSMFAAIESVSGQRPAGVGRRALEIVKADAQQATLLHQPVGEPLFHLDVEFLDARGEPICIGQQYYIGSRYMFEL